ncbi:hypothetical protein E2C01_072267 [Portunus trituberculatus]|uniref:Uncharacterized protein n=1 Tax=Portunus trituberculatus TaxID=210409 RepID=A0A5B7HXJ1_PORTR|nr:hypothetical protein [Portunus trituberculatus]
MFEDLGVECRQHHTPRHPAPPRHQHHNLHFIKVASASTRAPRRMKIKVSASNWREEQSVESESGPPLPTLPAHRRVSGRHHGVKTHLI